MQINRISNSKEVDAPQIDIFRLNYPGAGRFQTGSFVITAASLNKNSEACGGGIVAEFANEKDAINCHDKIVEINAKHEPVISTYEEIYLGEERQFIAAQLRERKAKNESSFNKAMRRQNRSGKRGPTPFSIAKERKTEAKKEPGKEVINFDVVPSHKTVIKRKPVESRVAFDHMHAEMDPNEYSRYLKNPLEFDTQTRKELTAKDNGQLPPRVAIDYRLIGHAYGEDGLENPERSTKAPFPTAGLIGSSRYRTGQLWMEERVAEFSSLSPEDSYLDESFDNSLGAKDLDREEYEEWLSLSGEEKIVEWERDDYWTEKYRNCNHQTIKPNSDTEIEESIIQREAEEDRGVDIEKIHLLSRGPRRQNREHSKLWKKITKENSHLSYPDQIRKFHRELESKKSKSKTISKRSRQEKRIA